MSYLHPFLTFRFLSLCSELSKVKVIDMTGPQQRVLSGYHALSGLKAPPGVEHYEDVVHKKCTKFALPELQHNLDLLVEMSEQVFIYSVSVNDHGVFIIKFCHILVHP